MKNYFSLNDAAKRLTDFYKKDHSQADVLQIILKKKLKASLFFHIRVYARMGKVVQPGSDEQVNFNSFGRQFTYHGDTQLLKGLYHLQLTRNGRILIENQRRAKGAQKVKFYQDEGVYVTESGGRVFEIQGSIPGESSTVYRPAVSLPRGVRIVISKSALNEIVGTVEHSCPELLERLEKKNKMLPDLPRQIDGNNLNQILNIPGWEEPGFDKFDLLNYEVRYNGFWLQPHEFKKLSHRDMADVASLLPEQDFSKSVLVLPIPCTLEKFIQFLVKTTLDQNLLYPDSKLAREVRRRREGGFAPSAEELQERTEPTPCPPLNHLGTAAKTAGENLPSVGPTAIPGGNMLNDKLHYFILCARAWKIRFDGGEECLIPTAQYMKTLAEYLKRPGEIIDKNELYNRVCRTGTITDWGGGGAEGLTPQKESQIEKLSSADKKKYEKKFEEVLDQHERAAFAGREEQEEAEEGVVNFIKVIGKEYSGALCDRKTGKITWPQKMMERSAATRSAENIPKHINRAIAAFREAGQKALADHLTNYLDKKISVYSPPQDFSGWHVET